MRRGRSLSLLTRCPLVMVGSESLVCGLRSGIRHTWPMLVKQRAKMCCQLNLLCRLLHCSSVVEVGGGHCRYCSTWCFMRQGLWRYLVSYNLIKTMDVLPAPAYKHVRRPNVMGSHTSPSSMWKLSLGLIRLASQLSKRSARSRSREVSHAVPRHHLQHA